MPKKTRAPTNSPTPKHLTEHQQQETLLKTGALQKAIFNSVNFSSIATDAKGVIQIFNVGAERMLGYAAADVVNKITPADISDPQEVIARAQALSSELETTITPGFEALVFKASRGIEDIYELTYIRKDGSRFPAVVSVTALRDTEEAIIGYLLIGTDNTARKQAAETLAISERRFRALIDKSHDTITLTAADGTMLYVTPSITEITGYLPEELIGQSRNLIIYPEEQDRLSPLFKQFMATPGMVIPVEQRIKHKNGSWRWIEGTGTNLLEDPTVGALVGNIRDITERKRLLEIQEETNNQLQQTNLTLQVSEEKLAVTLNSIGDAVVATDAKGRVTLLNRLAEQLTGWTQAEAIGRPVEEVFKIINQTTRKPATIPVMDTLAHGTTQGLANHTVLIARDGSECAIADSCAPIRDRGGRVVGAVLVCRDVTEEYAVQQALRDSTALIQTILNTVVDGIITLQAQGGLIETVNPATEKMFGYNAEELVGKNVGLLIPGLALGQHSSSLTQYSANEGAQARSLGREMVGRRKDGSVFPMEMAVSEMSLGGQHYFTGILRDITTRKQAEEEQKKLDQRLRDQQFYTRSLIESNIDALMTTDPHGIITDVNKQTEALTGCTRDELIGAPFKNYFTNPDLAEAYINRVLREKKITDCELTARSRDGKETVVSYNAATLYDRDRKLQGVFAAARDITERARLDLVLQEKNVELETAKLVAEKANLAKSEFLSSMSHELRSPLNAILGFAQLMDASKPPPTAMQKTSIEQILQAGWHLLELINEILDLAVVESGKLSMSVEPVSLEEVMQECQAMIEHQSKKRNLKLTFPIFELSHFVRADRLRLKQVLINLLTNALKYNLKGGTVEVEYSRPTPERTRLSIRDTGLGLAPEKVSQLFQPFNRLGQESSSEEGTGIGLVMSKLLVELMGGIIGVESTVGVGSIFWFELDSVIAPQLTLERAKPISGVYVQVQPDAKLRTLLYVEDNKANLKLVEQIIASRHDLRLLSALNGTHGIELARDLQPEVILMDINLPGISGIEAMKILREDPLTGHIPVLALSANAMLGDIKKGKEAGFFRYLTKPIKVNEFLEALDVALEFADKKADSSK